MVVDAIIDERTLREIYLPGFEITVKGRNPDRDVRLNLLNGTYLAENHLLLTRILEGRVGPYRPCGHRLGCMQ